MTLTRAQRAIVVDASIAIPLLQSDAEAFALWDAWRRRGDLVLAPPNFSIELANGLLGGTSIRSAARVVELLQLLTAAGYEVADRGATGIERAVQLAATHGLTVYDAAYLDLAIDVDGELATRDGGLRQAAGAEGVPVLP